MHIYCITNLINGKIYIGQHNRENLLRYLKNNISLAMKGKSNRPVLDAAFRKYGGENFSIVSLVRPMDKYQANELEKFFIRTLDSRCPDIGYNIAVGGGVVGIPHTEEFKIELSKRRKGFKASDETKRKISESKKGVPSPLKGTRMSLEQRQKLSISMKGHPAWNKGISPRPESIAKLVQSNKEFYSNQKRNPNGTFARTS